MGLTFRQFLSIFGLIFTIPAFASISAQTPAAPAPQTQAAPLPRVHLFATGGTISNKAGGRLTAEELIQSIPGLDRKSVV